VYRRRQRGESYARAAIEGTIEVGPAVVASTLTSVAVFLPIVFVEGVAGQLFKDQALTVTIGLLASLVVAVTLIPMLSSLGGSRVERASSPPPIPVDSKPEVMTLGAMSRIYDRFLRGALRQRWLTIVLAALAFLASVGALSFLGTELIPPLSEGEFLFEVNLPEGTPIETTDKHIREMEKVAEADPNVERTYSTVGTRLVTGGLSMNTKSENLGQVNIVMKDDASDATEADSIEKLRHSFQEIPDLEIKFGRPSYFSLKTPIEVVIFGEDLDDLREYSLDVARRLEDIPGLVDVRSSLEAGHPELQVKFDDDKLAAHGLNRRALSTTIKNRVQGAVATRFRKPDRQIDIRIRNLDEDKSSKNDVENLIVSGAGGKQMPLLHVASVIHARGPAEIHRVQQQRAAVITANLKGRSLGSAIREVEAELASMPKKEKMTTELGGQNREMKVSFESLRFALALAVFMVYLVMASVFESFIHPLIVLFTIPLSLVGVVIGLLATNTNITVIVLIGSVMLVGIVVNNAIVLIDAVNQYRQRGLDKREAVIRAGHVRLRPIVMTTLTTILGLMPMAISWGDGAELRAPLAITVASGLFFSTLLTLVVIPAVYMVMPSGVHALPGEEEDAK
jgi:HAE1 family hydrophobic/amphiphilic exporter-1